MKLDYAHISQYPKLCDAAFGDVLCIEVTDVKTEEMYVGIVEKE